MNLHYRHAASAGPAGFLGLLGGDGGVGVRQARRPVGDDQRGQPAGRPRPRSDLAATVWLGSGGGAGDYRNPYHAWRVVKEKRATFAATPAENRKRPGARTDPREPRAGGGLDGYRAARHHRGRDQVRSQLPPRHCFAMPPEAGWKAGADDTTGVGDARCLAKRSIAQSTTHTLTTAIDAAGTALQEQAGRRRPLAVPAGGGRHHPLGIRAARALPRPDRPGAGGAHRRVSAQPAERGMAVGRCSMVASPTCR